TNDAGAFAIGLDPQRVPARLVGTDGSVRVIVIAADSQHQLAFMFSMSRQGQGWATTAGMTRGDATPADVRFDLGSRPTALEEDEAAGPHSTADGSPAAGLYVATLAPRTRLMTPDVGSVGACGAQSWGTTYYNRTEKYRPAWSWSGADATVTEEVGDNQQLGV